MTALRSRPSPAALLFTGMLVLLSAIGTGCGKANPPAAQVRGGAVPTVAGKVLTVRTVVPGQNPITHLVGVHEGKVRLGYEADRWRLIDVPSRTVTFVDDIEETYRTVPLQTLVQQRRALLAAPLPSGVPRAEFQRLPETRTYAGYEASGYVISAGGYRREIWLSQRPIIAPEFLTLYLASTPFGEEYAGVMRTAFSEMAALQGFPVHEQSEMTIRDKTLSMERTLMRVEEKEIPAQWFEIPAGYVDLAAPATTPAADRPSGASTPRGRKAPAAESPPSGKSRTDP